MNRKFEALEKFLLDIPLDNIIYYCSAAKKFYAEDESTFSARESDKRRVCVGAKTLEELADKVIKEMEQSDVEQ